MFTKADLKQITSHQLTEEGLKHQIDKFITGFPPTVLADAATEGNGILKLDEAQADSKVKYYEDNLSNYEIVKFVPASGAATRMFKSLFSFLHEYQGTDEDYEKMKSDQDPGSVYTFFKRLENFAFYDDLKNAYQKVTGNSLEEALLKKEYKKILEVLLNEEGLNYGNLPKGLLQFHQYESESRTPVEEHMVEGAQYAQDSVGNVTIHFTVSPDHQQKFEEHVAQVKSKYESKFSVKIHVTYSIQKPSTDTIAVDMDNKPFRNDDGSLLFRPAGHGALLENLNDINADIVFLKNIDNVVPDKIKEETIKYKKVLAGILLDYQSKIASAITKLESGSGLTEAKELLEDHLGFRMGSDFDGKSDSDKVNYLKAKLHRPLRVCGMVKSEGDPGGGPFWVKAVDGSDSLQIVETAQVDLSDEDQKKIFGQATHFNPVDVVCMLKDHNGNKFDLMEYRDLDAGFTTKKSKDGKDLKAQELPGLWNGSMADWNTVFVEVPVITFNPVKSVNDLLKEEHQAK